MIRICKRCEYEWTQRGLSVPRQCPFCKSPKWNLARAAKPVDRLVEAGAKIAAVARGPIELMTASALEQARHWEPVED